MSRPFQDQSLHAARRVPLGSAQRRGARDDQAEARHVSRRRSLARSASQRPVDDAEPKIANSSAYRVARVLNWLCTIVQGRERKPKDDVVDAASSLENSTSPAMNLRGDAGGSRLSDVERTLVSLRPICYRRSCSLFRSGMSCPRCTIRLSWVPPSCVQPPSWLSPILNASADIPCSQRRSAGDDLSISLRRVRGQTSTPMIFRQGSYWTTYVAEHTQTLPRCRHAHDLHRGSR
jgi:hypothetical protein